MRMRAFAAITAAGFALGCAAENALILSSPDGRNEVKFEKAGQELVYSVKSDGQDIILPSRAGLEIDNLVWEMALGKRDLEQPESWMTLLEPDSVTYGEMTDTLWHPL